MAATLLTPRGNRASGPPPRTPIPKATRLEWRESYGDVRSLHQIAEDELAAGQYGNAMTAYQHSLCQWLRGRWMAESGKYGTPITDPKVLLGKLRGSGTIDRWLFEAILQSLRRPHHVDRRHVEIVAAVVSSLTLEPIRTVGGDQCLAD